MNNEEENPEIIEAAQCQDDVIGEGHSEEKIEITNDDFQKFVTLAQEVEQLREQTLRAAAEHENSKKRLERMKDDAVRFANESFMGAMLPVLDNLERALSHMDPNAMDASLVQGLDLVRKQFHDTLKNLGLEKIEAIGKPFDPHLHEAIATVASDEFPEDAVVDELIPGYRFRDRILRATQVRVAAPISKNEAEGGE